MDPIYWFLLKVDPMLVAPYRWFGNPMLGWWMGTFILALWSVFLGELTLMLAYRANRRYMAENLEQTIYYYRQSFKAKRAGDEKAYKLINRQANEEFGKSFFLFLAMGIGSLWPAYFAVAWLNKRFGDIDFILPAWAGGFELNYLAPFILLYIAARIIFSRIKRSVPFLRRYSSEIRRKK
jgi:hypothetical protein